MTSLVWLASTAGRMVIAWAGCNISDSDTKGSATLANSLDFLGIGFLVNFGSVKGHVLVIGLSGFFGRKAPAEGNVSGRHLFRNSNVLG